VSATELFQSGRLSEAIDAAVQEVKDQPGELSRRTLLFSLLCFAGELERAKKQLDVLSNQVDMSEAPTYANLITAELTRRKVLNEGQRPKFFGESTARIEKHLLAASCIAQRRFEEAKRLLDEAEEDRPAFSGTCNGVEFDDFADADDITRCILEFQQGPNYYWVPFDDMVHLQVVLPEPVRPYDLYWAPCQIVLTSGETQRGFTPAMYVNSYLSTLATLRLGHETQFHDIGSEVYRGTGRKQFVAGEADPTVLDLKDVSFAMS